MKWKLFALLLTLAAAPGLRAQGGPDQRLEKLEIAPARQMNAVHPRLGRQPQQRLVAAARQAKVRGQKNHARSIPSRHGVMSAGPSTHETGAETLAWPRPGPTTNDQHRALTGISTLI